MSSPAAPRPSNGAQWVLLAVVTIGSLALMFALAEGAIRLRQAARFGTAATIERFYTIDPRTGLRVPIANLRDGPVAINSLGFRGPEIAVPKPPGHFADTAHFTDAGSAAMAQRVSRAVEAELRRRGGAAATP